MRPDSAGDGAGVGGGEAKGRKRHGSRLNQSSGGRLVDPRAAGGGGLATPSQTPISDGEPDADASAIDGAFRERSTTADRGRVDRSARRVRRSTTRPLSLAASDGHWIENIPPFVPAMGWRRRRPGLPSSTRRGGGAAAVVVGVGAGVVTIGCRARMNGARTRLSPVPDGSVAGASEEHDPPRSSRDPPAGEPPGPRLGAGVDAVEAVGGGRLTRVDPRARRPIRPRRRPFRPPPSLPSNRSQRLAYESSFRYTGPKAPASHHTPKPEGVDHFEQDLRR